MSPVGVSVALTRAELTGNDKETPQKKRHVQPFKINLHVSLHEHVSSLTCSLTCFRVAEIIDAQELVVSSGQQTVAVLRGRSK